MKKLLTILIFIITALILLIGIYFYLQQPTPSKTSQISPTSTLSSPTPSQIYCTSKDILASVSLSPGAGNVYGTFTLKNISNHKCQLLGNEFIEVNYDTNNVKNISVSHIGTTQKQPFVLSSGQILYSQVHYPNGPQCQSVGINAVKVTFTYKISPTDIVTFENQPQNIPLIIQACKSPKDITEIQIWNISEKPITP